MKKNLLITLFLSIALVSVVFAGTNIDKNYTYKSQAGTYHHKQMQNLGTYGNHPPMMPYGNMYSNRQPMPTYGNMYGNRPLMPPYGNMYGNRQLMPTYGNMYGNRPPKQNPFTRNYPVTLPLFDESRPVAP